MNKNSRKKNRFLKFLGFGFLFVSSLFASIFIPIYIQNNKTYSLNINTSTSTYEGNKNRIDNFINQNFSQNTYSLNGSLKVYGKEGVIGENGENELTRNQRSLITVDQAWDLNLFKFEFKSNIYYSMYKNKINYSIEYIKPYVFDSSYPTVGIKFFYGQGHNYYETIFEYRDANLYGFKKVNQQLLFTTIFNEIEKNPGNFFILKESVGNIGDPGIYAKSITTNDFNLNSEILKQIREQNYFLKIHSVSPDKFNPSLLKITYSLTYDDGDNLFVSSSRETVLGNFDIEEGVDDPVSKLKLFIKNNQDWINNLYQYFVFENQESDENEERQLITARDAYKQNLISFSPSYSISSKLSNEGITMEFKTYQQEDQNELSVLNYIYDSSTPMYRIYFSSYSGTPLEYTESVLIEGIAQEGEFQISQQENKMNAFEQYLLENNQGFEDIFDFEINNNNNPLSLSNFFTDKNITYTNNKYNLSFEIVFNQWTKFLENPEIYSNPFNKFKITIKNNVNLEQNYSYENSTYNLNEIANEIKNNFNNSTNIDEQLISINQENRTFNFNLWIGNDNEGNKFLSIYELSLNINEYFQTNSEYVLSILNNLNITNENVKFTINVKNKESIKEYIEQRKIFEIFDSVNITNIDNFKDVVTFPELIEPLTFEIENNFNYNKEEIDNIINSESLEITLKISIGDFFINKQITKTFDQLLQGN